MEITKLLTMNVINLMVISSNASNFFVRKSEGNSLNKKLST